MVQRPPRQKPHIWSIHGPIPPRHPRKRAGQLVWPRDKKGTSFWSWARLQDVLTMKGPDIWCSRRGSLGPHRPIWSKWRTEPWEDNLGYLYDNQPDGPHWFWAKRPGNKKYDFRTRSYRVPDHRTWADVKRSEQNNEPLYWCDRWGREIVGGAWVHPSDNPYAYNEAHLHDDWDWDEWP